MKIGLTTTSFRTDKGAERFVVNLSKGLLQADQEVHLIGRLEHKDTYEAFCDELSGLQRSRFHFHRIRSLKAHRYPNLLTFAWGVHKKLKTLSLDVTQGFGKSLGLDIFRPPTATYKTLLQQANPTIKSHSAANLELDIERRILFEGAKAVVVNSRLGEEKLRLAYPKLRIPIHLIYNMIDLGKWRAPRNDDEKRQIRKQLGIPEDVCVFLHVSTNFRLKGALESMQALETIKKSHPGEYRRIYMVLIGDDSVKVPQAIADRVSIFKATNRIAPFFLAADVLLHPTHFDPFANVVLEAFSSGLPVITSKNNGAWEVIDHETHGTILETVDVAEISRTLLHYLDNQMIARMKRAVLARAQQFSIESIVQDYIQLYEQVSKQKRQSSKPDRHPELRPLKPLLTGSSALV